MQDEIAALEGSANVGPGLSVHGRLSKAFGRPSGKGELRTANAGTTRVA